MFRLGRQVESALLAVKALYEANGGDVPVSDICSKYGLSKNSLAKVMQSLSSHNLIESSQGTRGGYKLKEQIESLSFYQVLDALGEIRNLKCRDNNETCSLSENCSISSPLIKWEKSFEDHLKDTKVLSLIYETPTPEIVNLQGAL